MSGKDTGIDLVAKTKGTEEYHAIQCKCYAEDYTVKKSDIDSFFTASGQKPFTLRYLVTTTNDWSDNAANSLHSQQPPVNKIDLLALETSQIDWAKYQPSTAALTLKPKKQLRPHQTSAKGKVTTGLASADRGKLIMACGTDAKHLAVEMEKRHDAHKTGFRSRLRPQMAVATTGILLAYSRGWR
jgi:predicted helicase